MNSLRAVERAVRSEMLRQAALLGRRAADHAGDPALLRDDRRHAPRPLEGGGDRLPLLPRARPRAVAPDAGWVERLRAGCPSCPLPGARDPRRLGVSAEDMVQMSNAGVVDLVGATVEAGAPVGEARNWWLGYLAQKANEREVDPAELAIDPAQVARLVELVGEGTLSVGARPPGRRRRARDRRGRRRGDRRAGPAGCRTPARSSRRRRGYRRESGHRREGARREAARRRRARRRGHEGDPWPGRCRRRTRDPAPEARCWLIDGQYARLGVADVADRCRGFRAAIVCGSRYLGRCRRRSRRPARPVRHRRWLGGPAGPCFGSPTPGSMRLAESAWVSPRPVWCTCRTTAATRPGSSPSIGQPARRSPSTPCPVLKRRLGGSGGRAGRRGVPSVWLADIGDNDATRDEVRIYRVDEPVVDRHRVGLRLNTNRAICVATPLPRRTTDAEALMVAPGGAGYVVTKSFFGESSVYAVPAIADPTRVQILRRVAAIRFSMTGTPGGPSAIGQLTATGAGMSADGRLLAVRTYTDAYLWPVSGGDIAAALRGSPVRIALPEQRLGEGIAVQKSTLLVDSEGSARRCTRCRRLRCRLGPARR